MAMTHEEKDKLMAEKDAQIAELMAQLEEKDSAKAQTDSEKDAQIAELMAQLKAAKGEHATDGATEGVEPEEKNVCIQLYKDEKIVNDQEVFVNGHPYLIQRGIQVDVPESVAKVLHYQQRMRNHIAAYNAKHADK